MRDRIRWIAFYNHLRPHAANGGQPPAVVYFNSIETDLTLTPDPGPGGKVDSRL
jgi:hypothetical protein